MLGLGNNVPNTECESDNTTVHKRYDILIKHGTVSVDGGSVRWLSACGQLPSSVLTVHRRCCHRSREYA